MIESAKADVVGPAIAADNPDALVHQRVGKGDQSSRVIRVECIEPLLQLTHSLALVENVRLILLLRVKISFASCSPTDGASACEKLCGELSLFVERDAEAETEFGVVFEERVAPGRPATLGVLRPGSRWQVAAVN